MINQFLKMKDEEVQDPQLMSGLTPGTSQPPMTPLPVPLTKTINQDGRQYQFTPGENGMLVSTPPPKPPIPPQVKSKAISLSPEKMDEIMGYLDQKKQQINQYGAQDQMAQQDLINEHRSSLPYKLGDAGTTFADAIMQGVARAGSGGFNQGFKNQQNLMAQEQMNALRGAEASNLRGVEAGMNLDRMDPSSVLSKTAQETYAPLFQKLGYPPEALKNMSGATIENALSLMTQMGGAEVQAKIKEYELEIERARLQGSLSKQASDEKIAEENQRIQAAKELAGRGTENRTFAGVSIPFTKKPTEASELGTKYLSEKLQGRSPEDQEALDWANQNPDDPRAAKIKARFNQ